MTDTYIPTETGHWVSERFERLARIVKDYDEHLDLCWIPPECRTDKDSSRPYAIVDRTTNYIVMYATELDTPEQILARLFMGDNNKENALLKLDAHNAAIKAMEMKSKLDEQDEQMEQIKFLMQSNLNYLRFNGKLLDDQRRKIR